MNRTLKRILRVRVPLISLMLAASLLFSSGAVLAQEGGPAGEPPEPAEGPPAAPKEEVVDPRALKDWTFMVYMAADNNLESAAIADFIEMANVGSNSRVNIVVQLDRIAGYDASYGNWKNTRRFYITKNLRPWPGNGVSIGEVDMGDDLTLKSFINWAKNNYPAQKYALILWNHGSGFQPMSAEIANRGIAWDDTSGGRYLTNREISSVLSQVTNAGAKKLELVGFDACLMAQMEVHQHIKSYARYGVGSEKTVPNAGWPYNTILTYLKGHPSINGLTFANQIVNLYYASYGGNHTHSAVRYDYSYKNVIWRLNQFSDQLIARININASFRTTIRNAYNASIKLDADGNFVDLSNFALAIKNRTGAGSALNTAAVNLINAVNQMVSNNKVGAAYSRAKGVTIFFPKSDSVWGSWSSSYKTYQWLARDTHWDSFLDNFYGSELVATLTWGTRIPDLDAHMWLPAATPYHVYFGNPGSVDFFPFARLDNDDNTFSGPERIRVSQFMPGVYQYAVYKFSSDAAYPTTLKNSGAVVRVYRDGTLMHTLNVSTAGGTATGKWWKVFTYNSNTDTFSWTNTLATSPGSAYSVSAGMTGK